MRGLPDEPDPLGSGGPERVRLRIEGGRLVTVVREGRFEAAMPPDRKIPERVPIRVSFAEPIPVEREEDAAVRRKEAVRLTAELRAAVEGMLRA